MESPTIVLLMGETGAGKSNFIRLASGLKGRDAPVVGERLVSQTKEPQSFECFIDEKKFVFLDTPGFDDTYIGDGKVLRSICDRLNDDFKNNLRVTSIIYLHNIQNVKMTQTRMRNLDMLRNLCGIDAFSNVALVSTFWDELLDKNKGAERESELLGTNSMWGSMSKEGAKSMRFFNTRESALEIMREIRGIPPIPLQVQEEIDQGRKVGETTAGVALNRELEEAKQKAKEELEILISERDKAHQAQLRLMNEQYAKDVAEMIENLEHEQALLRADSREQIRREKQWLEDEVLRNKRQSDKQIAELDLRLKQEGEQHEAQIQKMLDSFKLQMEEVRKQAQVHDDRMGENHTKALERIQERYEEAEEAANKWRKYQKELDEQRRTIEKEYMNAPEDEKPSLADRVKEVEEKRESNWSRYLASIRSVITTTATLAIAILGGVALA